MQTELKDHINNNIVRSAINSPFDIDKLVNNLVKLTNPVIINWTTYSEKTTGLFAKHLIIYHRIYSYLSDSKTILNDYVPRIVTIQPPVF